MNINTHGDIVGYYQEQAGGPIHGFIRTREGTVDRFDVPHSTATFVAGMTPSGTIVGSYSTSSPPFSHGFVLTPKGEFETIDIPGASGTGIGDITPDGTLLGGYADDAGTHGFVRTADGQFQKFDAPRAANTYAVAIARSGIVAGSTPDSGFVRDARGNVTVFGAPEGRAYVSDVDERGAVVGIVLGAPSGAPGFIRRPDGSLLLFNVTGPGDVTQPNSINSRGMVTGLYDNLIERGAFVGVPGRWYERFSVEGNGAGMAINSAGSIAGIYRSESDEQRGFLRSPDGSIETFGAPVDDPLSTVRRGPGSATARSEGTTRSGAAESVSFGVAAISPNPFRNRTSISFQLPREADVRVEVFDLGGRRVRTLASGSRSAGRHELNWDGTGDTGSVLEAGVYLVRMQGGGFCATRRVMLLR